MAQCDLSIRVVFDGLERQHVDTTELWEEITSTVNVNIEGIDLVQANTSDEERTMAVEVVIGHSLTVDDIDYVTSQTRRHVRQELGLLGSGVQYDQTIIDGQESDSDAAGGRSGAARDRGDESKRFPEYVVDGQGGIWEVQRTYREADEMEVYRDGETEGLSLNDFQMGEWSAYENIVEDADELLQRSPEVGAQTRRDALQLMRSRVEYTNDRNAGLRFIVEHALEDAGVPREDRLALSEEIVENYTGEIELTDEMLSGFAEVMHDNGVSQAAYSPLTAGRYPDDPSAIEEARNFAENAAEWRADRDDPEGAAEWRALAEELERRL